MKCICAWCGAEKGEKPGEGITHGICEECERDLREKYGLSVESHRFKQRDPHSYRNENELVLQSTQYGE